MSITAIAGSALLLGVTTSLQTTTEAMDQAIATGIAQQLLDEIVGARYAAGSDAHQVVLGPSWYEQNGPGRQRYNDIDDYTGLRIEPLEDLWGVYLGTDDGQGDQRHPGFQITPGYFDNWRAEIDVYYVDQSNLSAKLSWGRVSDYRAVDVHVYYVDPERGKRQLAQLRRVVAYVPPL